MNVDQYRRRKSGSMPTFMALKLEKLLAGKHSFLKFNTDEIYVF